MNFQVMSWNDQSLGRLLKT